MGGKVIIIGSVNVDIVTRAPRLPVAGETVSGGDLAVLLGGKGANQAVAAAQAGADANMIGAIGAQSFGLDPLTLLKGYGVAVRAIKQVDSPTGAALITVDDAGENQITVSPGANAHLVPADVGEFSSDVVLAQLETPQPATIAVFQKAKAQGGMTILNAAPAVPVDPTLAHLTDILIVNETELALFSGHAVTGGAEQLASAMRAARRAPDQRIVATLGGAGALALDRDQVITVPAAKAERVSDTTGAGDCFCGALAASLAEGSPLPTALHFAAAAASLAVETHGAAPSMPHRTEIEARLTR